MRKRLQIDLIYTQVIILCFCTAYYAVYHLQVSFLLYKWSDDVQCGGFWLEAPSSHIKRFLGPPASDRAGIHQPMMSRPYPIKPDVAYRTMTYGDFYGGTLHVYLYSTRGNNFRVQSTYWYTNDRNIAF